MSGLVTLALLAILLAYIVTRVMRRLGMSVSRDRMIGIMAVFVIVVLMMWGESLRG